MEEERDPETHRSLCVLRVQTGAAKYLRDPLAASALDVVTVPSSPHTRKSPEHSLGYVRVGLEEERGPETHRPLHVLQ
jgi:hypothetical protein